MVLIRELGCRAVMFLLTSLLSCITLLLLMLISQPTKLRQNSIIHGFGVGFDLNPSYGTVAVSYANGSTHSVARIEGNKAYREMMFRLSLPSSVHLHEPYQNIGDNLDDIPRQLLRGARKRLGLPASKDVGTLATMISALRAEAATFTRQTISAATISIPRLVALYGEDTLEAFHYLNLENIQFYPFKDLYAIHAANTVYAGHGRGLCTNYTNVTACMAEEQVMPEVYALAISYTNSSLTASLAQFRAAKYVEEVGRVEDLTLGYDSRHVPRHGSPINDTNEYFYWEMVRAVLAFPVLDSRIPRNVTKVLLWGDVVYVPKFREVLDEVVGRVVIFENPEILDTDPVFGGARGVAEFAKRAFYSQEGQTVPLQAPEDL